MSTLWSITLRKISKIGATRCLILRLKCTKFDSQTWVDRLGLRPRQGWELTALPRTPSCIKEGLLLRGKGRRGNGGRKRGRKREVG